MASKIIYFVLLSVFVTVYGQLSPVVKLPLGKIQGTLDKSAEGKTFYKFDGIPYARPPTGAYRFKAPVPPEPWKGIWKADTKYLCIQYSNFPRSKLDPIDGTEDCLYLNVHTPRLNASLDVLVYFHGGAFVFGTGVNYEGHILVDRDIVTVTMNYRLGPLGFLSTEDDVVPGNNGLKDQILVLKWIQENIQYFGGNPNSVTITGMSAGGASVHFHTMSPKSKGLFHKTVSMSGCMLNPWAIMEKPLERTKELASIVGCDEGNMEETIECLRGRPAKQIVAVVGKFQPWMYSPFSTFAIVVDEWASDPLLPKHPLKLMKAKAVTDIPGIISHCTAEGLYNGMDFFPKENLKYIDEHWNEVMPHILHYNFTIEKSHLNDISAKIRKEYLESDHLTRANYNKLIDLMGDRLFNVDLDKCTRLQAAVMKSPVYHYVFGHKGAYSFTVRSGTTDTIGATHGDDTVYVLKAPYAGNLEREDDRAMTKVMLDLYASFTKDGKPKTVVEWPPVSKNVTDHIKYLKIDSPTSIAIEEVEEFGNRKFWDTLPFEENEKLIDCHNKV